MEIRTISILDLNPKAEIGWDEKCDEKFSNLLWTQDQLFAVVLKIGYKAALGVAITLTELIQKLSEKSYPHINTAQEFAPKIESLWAGAIDPLYLKTWEFGFEYHNGEGG